MRFQSTYGSGLTQCTSDEHGNKCALGVSEPNHIRCTSNLVLSASVNEPVVLSSDKHFLHQFMNHVIYSKNTWPSSKHYPLINTSSYGTVNANKLQPLLSNVLKAVSSSEAGSVQNSLLWWNGFQVKGERFSATTQWWSEGLRSQEYTTIKWWVLYSMKMCLHV